jgi:integrase/recombinase XerD
VTFDEALAAHLDWMRARNYQPSSIAKRRTTMRRLERRLGIDPLTATEKDLDKWVVGIARLAPITRACEIAHVSVFFRWAVTNDVVSRDPTLKIARPKVPSYVPRPIGESDLLVAIAGSQRDERMWFLLAAWAGLRASEIASLTREGILDTAKRPLLRVTGKGAKTRIVHIGPRLVMELQAYGLPSRGYVFRRLDGKTGSNTGARVSARANATLHGLGITDTLHQLRHRYGTDFYDASGGDIKTVQEQMGHEHMRTTAGYVAFSAEAAASAARLLDDRLGLVLVDTRQGMLL